MNEQIKGEIADLARFIMNINMKNDSKHNHNYRTLSLLTLMKNAVIAFAVLFSFSAQASAQVRSPDSLSENFTPNLVINGGCSNDPNVLIDGGIAVTAGYCPVPGQPTYEISFNYTVPPIDNFYQSIIIFANTGNIYTDGELRIFNLEIDYLDATTGAPVTFSQADIDIGNTSNPNDPRIISFSSLSGLPDRITGISQIRLSDLRVVDPLEAAFREIQLGIATDFSDSPITGTSYGTASHDILSSNIFLGATVTQENAGFDSPAANADIGDDGIVLPNLVGGSTSYEIPASNITASGTATLHAWIDFNNDGIYGTDEYTSVSINAGSATGSLQWATITNPVTVGQRFARFRLTTDALTNSDFATAAADGEVEDYAFIVSINADFSVTKTNTPSVNGEVDQANDTVTSGETTTYVVIVTNNGPDNVTGAVVTDTPTSGLTCTGTDSVTITGDGVPSGSFTIADLTGAGITLGTLANGESTTLTYSCTVN